MAGIIVGVSGLVIGVAQGVASKWIADNKAKKEGIKEQDAARKLAALERSRQAVIDQSGAIRDLKKQVNNPYANLAVATQAADLKIEQTDQALANTLDQINQSGSGGGAATVMARMAAASKAQVGASLEVQEVENNKLRAEGQAAAEQQKMQIEQAALSAEEAAWGRQEGRDLASLDRLAGLQQNAQAQAASYQMQGNQALMSGISSGLSAATAGGTAYAEYLSKTKGACFKGSDLVEMFNGTMKTISKIESGDEIKSIQNGAIVKGIVTNMLIHPTNDVVEVVEINGITAEPYHPILVDNEWIPIKALGEVSNKFIDNWYNLEVDGNTSDSEHNYIIGGLIASGLGDNPELNKKYQRQPKELIQHLNIEFKQI